MKSRASSCSLSACSLDPTAGSYPEVVLTAFGPGLVLLKPACTGPVLFAIVGAFACSPLRRSFHRASECFRRPQEDKKSQSESLPFPSSHIYSPPLLHSSSLLSPLLLPSSSLFFAYSPAAPAAPAPPAPPAPAPAPEASPALLTIS
eukprot:749461-Hanusia_phi.AAC.5